MKMLRRIFAPKEVRITLNILDEVGLEFDCEAFRMLKTRIEDAFLRDYNQVVSGVKEGISPRQQVYTAIANLAGDYVESGEYHLYRGWLNPFGPGEDLLRLFDASVDKLVQMRACSVKEAKAQKAGVREGIKTVG